MDFYHGLLDRKCKLIVCLLVIGLCRNYVDSYVDHKGVAYPNDARNVPDGFVKVGAHSISSYLYEIMSCYANKGYPCRKNPAFIGGHVTCLSKDKVCDGIKQCPYGDDENGRCDSRPEFCESNQVRCVDDGRCATTCDGLQECKYAADEKQCDKFPCGEHQVLCSDGKCAGLCDGIKECQSGKDENGCLQKCDPGKTICPQSGKCAKFCDGKRECDQGEDEQSCPECPVIEPEDIPCDMVRLYNCFFNGHCRLTLLRNPTLDCNDTSRVRRTSRLLMPCAGDTIQAESIGIPKELLGCKSRRTLAECMCFDNESRPPIFGDTFESCMPVMFDMLGDCKFLAI